MALREVLAKFGFEIIDGDKLDKAEKKADGFADSLKEIAGVILGEELIDRVKGFVEEVQGAADAISDTSAQLGVAADDLQRWQFAAQMSGSSAEQLNTALLILQKNAAAAAEGGGGAADVFREMGVDIKDASGNVKSATQLMGDIGLEIAGIEGASERTAAALKVFGKQGASLVPIFANGEEGLQALLDRFDELGGGFSQEALESAGAVGDAIDEMSFATMALKGRLAVSLFPTLAKFLGYLTQGIAMLSKASETTNVLKATLIVFGVAATNVALDLYAKYLPFILLIGGLILLVDDLITGFEGGDSAIGKLLDKLLGEGAGKGFFKWAREGIDDLMSRVDKMPTIGEKVEEVFSSLGATVVAAFVDDIPAAWDLFWERTNAEFGYKGKGFIDFVNWWVWNEVAKPFNKWFADAATYIVDGLIKGLEDSWDKVTDAFSDLGGDIIKVFRDKFKIRSPAKVPREDTHEIGNGIILGFKDKQREIETQAKETYGKALPPGYENSYTPTIRAPGGSSVVQYNTIEQTNSNQFTVQGGSNGGSIANDVRDGAARAFNDDRRAALNALVALAPE